MAANIEYFTQYHLYKALSCPIKLYYAKQGKKYPTRNDRKMFGEHNGRMRKKLELITRFQFEPCQQIDTDDYGKAAKKTSRFLNSNDEITLYNGILRSGIYHANVPLIKKEGQTIELITIRLKGANPQRIQKQYFRTYARSRWKKYLIDLAYCKWVAKAEYAGKKINCTLVLPDISTENQIASAYQKADLHYLKNRALKKQFFNELKSANNFTISIDLTKLVDELLSGGDLPLKSDNHFASADFTSMMKNVTEIWRTHDKPPSPVGKHCKNCEYRVHQEELAPTQISGFAECWQPLMDNYSAEELDSQHILSLVGHGKDQHLANNTFSLKQVKPQLLNTNIDTVYSPTGKITQADRQYFQVQKSKNELLKAEFIKEDLFKELNQWQYPLHFIDFESATLPIPIRKGGKAYEILVFQFSCHTLFENGDLNHTEWLNTEPGCYPNDKMVRAFLKIPQINSGTFIQFSPFEKNAFKKIRRQLKTMELSDKEYLLEEIHHIISRPDSNRPHGPYFADMYRLIKSYYYNKYMDGNLGMKSALHGFLQISSTLKTIYRKPYNGSNYKNKIWWKPVECSTQTPVNPYRLIENGLMDGSEAFALYGILQQPHISSERRTSLQHLLKKYCELDTLGLVMMYQHFQHVMDEL